MARIGWTKCGTCGNTEAAVSETGTGTLGISCHKCQFSGYAKAGTKAARLIRAAMTPDDDAAPAPAPVAAPPAPKAPKAKASPEPAPPPKPANSVFSLADL